MTDVAVVLAIVAFIAAARALLHRRDGAVRAVDGSSIDLAGLGVPRGSAAFVEFTTRGCAPCARTARVLHGVAEGRPGIAVVTVDVAEHLELARAHGVLRAPTTLLVDADGAVRHRIAGVPDAPTMAALLDGHSEAAA